MATSDFDEYMQKAVAPGPERLIPGCVLAVVNKDGIIWSKSYGTQSINPTSPLANKPLDLDTTMWIASCTKLMTSVCALQCVEKGLLNLDAPISDLLPEWKNPDILKPSDPPTYEKATRPMTLRHLLTHSAGLTYRQLDPRLAAWENLQETKPNYETASLHDICFLPLLYEPGTGWSYGVGNDWAGQLVEKVSGKRLGDYMQEHIWGPLGMESTTFRLQQRPDIIARRTEMTARTPGVGLVPTEERFWPETTPDDYGGSGCYSSVGDYTKVLAALLRDDGTLLKQDTITNSLFAPNLTPESKEALHQILYAPYPGNELSQTNMMMTGALPKSAEVNYSLAGLVVENDVFGSMNGGDGKRRVKGSVSWGGLPNLVWCVDRKTGVAFMMGGQLLPPGDPTAFEVFRVFEEAVYAGALCKL